MKDTTKFREKSPPSFSFAVSSDQGLEDGEDQGSHDKTHVSGALGHNPSASFGMAAEGDVSIFFGGFMKWLLIINIINLILILYFF
jgi:hypothetical protein